MPKKKTESQIAKEIIKRYGDLVDLRRSPYLIIEIIKQYGPLVGASPVAVCLPPGGPPKRPQKGELVRQLQASLDEAVRVASLLDHKSPAKSAPRSGNKRPK